MRGFRLRRLVAVHIVVVLAEWGSGVAVLVYAHERGGATATGLASLALLATPVVGAPLAGMLANSRRAGAMRLVGLIVQAGAYAAASVAAFVGAPTTAVVAATVVAFVAIETLRPTTAVLLPSLVNTSRQLSQGNLWVANGESACGLLGSLAAAGLLALDGPGAALAGAAAVLALSTVVSAISIDFGPVPRPRSRAELRPDRMMVETLAVMRQRPWSLGVLSTVSARNILLGALDVVLVVAAFEILELGPSGPGVLEALVGAGALASMVAATVVVRRERLQPALVASMIAAAGLCLVLAATFTLPIAIVVLPVLGMSLSLLDNLSRMLLQRSAEPAALGAVFSLAGLIAGLGQLSGSAIAQGVIAVASVEAAMAVLAGAMMLILALAWRSLRHADNEAAVPVVEMALLRGMPMFSPMPAMDLEVVSRLAQHLDVAQGDTVIVQGDPGDTFYAVVSGEFDVVMSGELVRSVSRGGWFGEVALLSDRPRTASVVATSPGSLLVIERVPFLTAVSGDHASMSAAMAVVERLRFD